VVDWLVKGHYRQWALRTALDSRHYQVVWLGEVAQEVAVFSVASAIVCQICALPLHPDLTAQKVCRFSFGMIFSSCPDPEDGLPS